MLRRVIKSVAAKTTVSTPALTLLRVVGSTDVVGAGTEHEPREAQPVILLDRGTLMSTGMPEFGYHPHYGHSVFTYLMRGQLVASDSATGETMPLISPCTYLVDAGHGVAHDEVSKGEGPHDIFQLWFAVPKTCRANAPRVQLEVSLPESTVADVSGKHTKAAVVRHVVGSKVPSLQLVTPLCVRHVMQQKGTTVRINVDPDQGCDSDWCTYVVHFVLPRDPSSSDAVSNASIVISGTESKATSFHFVDSPKDDASDASSSYIEVTAPETEGGEAVEHYLVVGGKPVHEPWVKLLGHNGACIAHDEATARRVMAAVAKEKDATNGDLTAWKGFTD